MLAMLRGFAAAFIAAVAAAVISSCGYGVFRILVSGSSERDVYGAFGFTAMYAAYLSARIALPAIVVAAVPYVLLSMKLRRTSLRYYVASGALIGTCGMPSQDRRGASFVAHWAHKSIIAGEGTRRPRWVSG